MSDRKLSGEGWLSGVPNDIVTKIKEIAPSRGTRAGGARICSYSLVRQPSTGPVEYADLRVRNEFGLIVSEEPVMRDGKGVGRFATDGDS